MCSRILALTLLVSLCSCAGWRPVLREIVHDCAAPALAREAADLVGRAANLLSGETWDGGAALDAAVKTVGPALLCAVSRIATTAAAMPQASLTGELRPRAVTYERQLLEDRAKAYLCSRQIKIKEL